MFYSGNDNYMQDLYFYNQVPMPNTYNSIGMPNYDNNIQNPINNMNNGMYMNQFQNMHQGQSINNLYPNIYRILMPVISKVIINSNFQYLNEDVLNNMVDTVYNITEGQIVYEDETNNMSDKRNNSQMNVATEMNQNMSNGTSSLRNTANSNNESKENQTMRNNSSSNNVGNERNDYILKDLIKILIIKELISRRQYANQNMQNGMNMYNMNNNAMNQFCNL